MSKLKDVHNQIWTSLKSKPEPLPVVRLPPPDRFKSKLERDYARTKLDPLVHSGTIEQYFYEHIRFRLGGTAFYMPDFVLWLLNGTVEVHELKGHMREAALVRFRIAQSMYTSIVWRMIERKGGQWMERKV